MAGFAIGFTLVALTSPALAAEPAPLPRKLAAIYNSTDEYSPRHTFLHRFLEMPANHLGYDMHYYDVDQPLPELGSDVEGVVVWFAGGTKLENPERYLDWLKTAIAQGKKLIILESLGVTDAQLKDRDVAEKLRDVLAAVGVHDDGRWHSLTYAARVLEEDHSIVGFEREYGPVLPAFTGLHAMPGKATSHLRVGTGDDDDPADLVVTGPGGGMVAEGYALFVQDIEDPRVIQWYINPFEFLRLALQTPRAPVPDITTLAGRRIFYSHIDGDGWNNISEIPRYTKTGTLSADVIRREIIEPYADFPFSVGLITADVDRECYGVEASEKVAREIFAEPNVEASSHTHTHPLFWRFFRDYDPAREARYLPAYPPKPAQAFSVTETMRSTMDKLNSVEASLNSITAKSSVPLGRNDETDAEMLLKYYTTPRSYACSHFDIDDEVSGSVKRIEQLTPPGKKISLLQWSGDTSPFEAAIAKTREAGLYNINGGDSRFDREYPSYAWVSSIGFNVGKEHQIYSSNSNENTYTNLWTTRFFGFRYLQTTVDNTEHPMRVRPFNLYFHVYSGQKQASLDAVKENLEYARHLELIPIAASHYAALATGFFTTEIIPTGPLQWSIRNRGALQTFRFDNSEELAVDWADSRGVVGYRHHQGNLYVALDPEQDDVVIQLTKKAKELSSPHPFLVESRWPIKGLITSEKSLIFRVQGYGQGTMTWQGQPDMTYHLAAARNGTEIFSGEAQGDGEGKVKIDFGTLVAIDPITVTLEEKK